MMVGERRGEDRSRTGQYGGTVRIPRSPASAARSALVAEANWGFRAQRAWPAIASATATSAFSVADSMLSEVYSTIALAAGPTGRPLATS